MKQNNFNALGYSHQPNNTKVLDLCDELGPWVMDEADMRCHGFYDVVERLHNTPEASVENGTSEKPVILREYAGLV